MGHARFRVRINQINQITRVTTFSNHSPGAQHPWHWQRTCYSNAICPTVACLLDLAFALSHRLDYRTATALGRRRGPNLLCQVSGRKSVLSLSGTTRCCCRWGRFVSVAACWR